MATFTHVQQDLASAPDKMHVVYTNTEPSGGVGIGDSLVYANGYIGRHTLLDTVSVAHSGATYGMFETIVEKAGTNDAARYVPSGQLWPRGG